MKMPLPKAPWSAAAELPPFERAGRPTPSKAAAPLPHSKALRAFSINVVSRKAHEICARNDSGQADSCKKIAVPQQLTRRGGTTDD